LLKPDNGFEIKMVRGFVHQQHVRAAKQNARQGHTHLPSARKRAHIAINLIVFKA
jgi:hypothetical protein